jgi:hypothetical protein
MAFLIIVLVLTVVYLNDNKNKSIWKLWKEYLDLMCVKNITGWQIKITYPLKLVYSGTFCY